MGSGGGGSWCGNQLPAAILDGRLMFNNNGKHVIVFMQSSRRHKIGRRRVRDVIADPIAVVRVDEEDQLVVIHAMDLRRKFRALYEDGKRP